MNIYFQTRIENRILQAVNSSVFVEDQVSMLLKLRTGSSRNSTYKESQLTVDKLCSYLPVLCLSSVHFLNFTKIAINWNISTGAEW